LVAALAAVTPGSVVTLGLAFQIHPGWHVYWLNPGDSGLPPQLTWQLPAGVTIDRLQFPTPKKFIDPPLASYGYENEVVLPMQLTLAKDFAADSLHLQADAKWLVCKGLCIMKSGKLSLVLPVKQQKPQADGKWQGAIAGALQQLPGKTPVAATAKRSAAAYTIETDAGALQITGASPDVQFFPFAEGIIDDSAPQKAQVRKQQLVLAVPRDLGSSKVQPRLAGLLVIDRKRAVTIDAPVN